MRIAFFGGSFDPVHNGHLFVVDEVLHLGLAERVVFVPAGRSPFKAATGTAHDASARDRLEMLRLALKGRPGMTIDKWEIERGEVSYTVDTVDHMYRDLQVTERLGMIIGADLLEGFDQWRESERLLSLVRPIIVGRPGFPAGEAPAAFAAADPVYVDNKIIAVSSSEIRRRVEDQLAYCDLVPAAVFDFIHKKGLYRDATR